VTGTPSPPPPQPGFPLPPPGQYVIDPVHSFVFFSVQHLVVGRVRGRFTGFAGALTVDADLAAWGLDVSVKTATVDTQNARRDEDLRSERFFDTEHFPQMTYAGHGIATESGGLWTIFGDLTIRDVTSPVPLTGRFFGQVTDKTGALRVAYEASALIKRRDFGLTAELDAESGGLVVGHDIAIDISAELVRR